MRESRFVLLAIDTVNEYQSSLVKCLHHMGECIFLLLAIGTVNEYLSSLVKCLHQMRECMFDYTHGQQSAAWLLAQLTSIYLL